MKKNPSRRTFLERTLQAATAGPVLGLFNGSAVGGRPGSDSKGPMAAATWNIGLPAVETLASALKENRAPLDALELGINRLELDPEVDSVGLGGLPNRDGQVELDAAVIDGPSGRMGCVAGMRDVAEAVSVARRIAETTDSIVLAGAGATAFAHDQGFRRRKLLTTRSRRIWSDWKKGRPTPGPGRHNHDTISVILRDAKGDLYAGCSSSGLAWKPPGRVGDAAVIGAGIYLDNRHGAAVTTGIGELCIRNCTAFAAVDLLRRGATPQEAAEQVIRNIVEGHEEESRRWQVGVIVVSKSGPIGAAAIQRGFQTAIWESERTDARLESSWVLHGGRS